MSDKKILDLDELFGQARAVKVKWGGQEYELARMEAFDPKQVAKVQALQRKAFTLQVSEDPSEEQADELGKIIDMILSTLCPSLPLTEITFVMKLRIVEFYIQETQLPKAMGTALDSTGETSSPV